MKSYYLNMAPAVIAAREAIGWTIRDLAQRAGVSTGTISAVENGHRDMTINTANKVAIGLGIRLVDLIGLAESLASKVEERRRYETEMRTLALQLLHKPELYPKKSRKA